MNISRKILTIDNKRNILALKGVLRSKGIPSSTADCAEEGWKLLSGDMDFGVALLDMRMPETNAYEQKCLDANGYISKPVDVDRLFSIVKRYL